MNCELLERQMVREDGGSYVGVAEDLECWLFLPCGLTLVDGRFQVSLCHLLFGQAVQEDRLCCLSSWGL